MKKAPPFLPDLLRQGALAMGLVAALTTASAAAKPYTLNVSNKIIVPVVGIAPGTALSVASYTYSIVWNGEEIAADMSTPVLSGDVVQVRLVVAEYFRICPALLSNGVSLCPASPV